MRQTNQLVTNQRTQGTNRLSSLANQQSTQIIIDQNDPYISDDFGNNLTTIRWSQMTQDNVLISGTDDLETLGKFHNILLTLRNQFTDREGTKIVIEGQKKDDFNKRLLLLEKEIQGLMKRKINYTLRDKQGGHRFLDYTSLLNQKETQVVQLQKKIQNLEEKLRRSAARELELQNHIVLLTNDLRKKQEIVKSKHQQTLIEINTSSSLRDSIQKIKKNIQQNRSKLGDLQRILLEGIILPEIGSLQIKADMIGSIGGGSIGSSGSARSGYQTQTQNQKNKIQMISLFREFERLGNNPDGITDNDIDRILEGFLLGLQGTRLRQSAYQAIQRKKLEQNYNKLRSQFGIAAGLYRASVDKIKQSNPNLRIDVDRSLFDILQNQKINVEKVSGDVVQVQRFSERTVEVPVQDARTKHLLHLLASQMKRISTKYPKLNAELDSRLIEFFQQQIIQLIQVDQVDRVVQILKYVPQVVKVQNVYAYSNQKSKKVEFHLRILIKALLEELEKLKRRTGLTLEIDEGIIGMINQQILGIVDIDDILKVFRVVPKIVEVEKVIEKIVEKIVEIPAVVIVQKIVQKIIEVEKIKEVEKIVNVPIQIPTVVNNLIEKIVPLRQIIQQVVEVPTITQKIVEVRREVAKIVQVQKLVDKIVEVDKVITVDRQVNHFVPEIKQVQVYIEKLVPVEKIIERIVEVPVIVQKIIEKEVQIPQIITVQVIVQKIVERVDYRIEKQYIPYVQIEHKIVEKIIEKPIPIIQKEQKIVQVPQIVQKIVQVNTIVERIKEVEVIVQKIVYQDKIREVEKIIKQIVPLIKQVQKIVEKRVQIPIIHEVIVNVPEIITKTLIQRIQTTVVKQVFIRDPLIVKQPYVIEVQKFINHYIDVPRIVKHIQQKIVEVPKVIERIKEVRVFIDKIIEKMVEVPKVVQVQRIVEKIVVVPRVIEKIVEVTQIVQVPVQKIIYQEKIIEVQRIVQLPIIQQKIVQVEREKIVYIEVQKVVDRIVDKLVQVPVYQEKVITHDILQQRIVEVIREIPRTIEVEKLVNKIIEVEKIVEVEKPIVVPVQINIPVDRIVEKLVPVYEIVQKIVQVPQIVQQIIEVKVEVPQIHEVRQVIRDIVIDTKIVEVPQDKIIIQERIVQIPTIREKVVAVTSVVQDIVVAQQIVQKVVERVVQIPKIYKVDCLAQKLVEVPKIVEIQTLVPQLVRVNNYIQCMVQKIIEVPIIIEKLVEVMKQKEKIVVVRQQRQVILQVEKLVQKTVIMQKFKEVIKYINQIQQSLQVIDRYEQIPVQIVTKQDRIVEVPQLLQKIVEKIVIMPQIVEVLKYVHEIIETEDLGIAIGVQASTHQQKYKLLTRDLKINIDMLLVQLRKLRNNPAFKIVIEVIEKFLAELQKFILFPKIIQVPVEKIVQKIIEIEKIVKIPTQDERSLKMQLTLSLLVQKLILQMKRIKRQNPNFNFNLEDDVRLIFFNQFDNKGSGMVSEDLNSQLRNFSDAIYKKFSTLGDWTADHQLMLNSFLQQRFVMANIVKNANVQIQKSRAISEKRLQGLRRYKSEKQAYESYVKQLLDKLTPLITISKNIRQMQQPTSVVEGLMKDFDRFIVNQVTSINEPIHLLEDMRVTDSRISSLIRQKDSEILKLKERMLAVQKSKYSAITTDPNERTIINLKTENTQLKNENSILKSKSGDNNLISTYDSKIKALNLRIQELQQQKSNLSTKLINLQKEYDVKINFYNGQIQQYKMRLDKSSISLEKYTQKTPKRYDQSTTTKGPTRVIQQRTQSSSNIKQSFQSPATIKSPVDKYDLRSPDYNNYGGMKMVQSIYKPEDNRTSYTSSISGGFSSNIGTGGQLNTGGNLTSSGKAENITYGTGGSGFQTQAKYEGSTSNLNQGTASIYQSGNYRYGGTPGGNTTTGITGTTGLTGVGGITGGNITGTTGTTSTSNITSTGIIGSTNLSGSGIGSINNPLTGSQTQTSNIQYGTGTGGITSQYGTGLSNVQYGTGSQYGTSSQYRQSTQYRPTYNVDSGVSSQNISGQTSSQQQQQQSGSASRPGTTYQQYSTYKYEKKQK